MEASRRQHYSMAGSAPPPVTGAHTYFGVLIPPDSTTTSQQPRHSWTTANENSPGPLTGIGHTFGQPKSPEKGVFERRVKDAVQRVQSRGLGIIDHTTPPDQFTQPMVQAIEGIRQQKQLGFLPDNQQWKRLNALLDDDRFVMSAILGHISANFLALSDEHELQRRVSTINGLTEDEFRAQMHWLSRQQSQVVIPDTISPRLFN